MATARKDAEAPQTTDPLELAAQAQESAETALAVSEAQGQDIATLKREAKSLAVLLNTLRKDVDKLPTEAGGDSSRHLNEIRARLEKLETDTRGVRYDWGPQIEALNGHLSAVQTAQANQATSITELLDKSGTEPGGQFEDLVRDLDEVKGGLATAADTFEALRAELDSIGDEFPHLRQQMSTNLKELAERLTALESGAQSPKLRNLAVPGVLAKLQALMDEVTVIAKTREAKPESGSRGPRYNFRGIEDAMNAVGAGMRKVGLLLRPEVVSWEHVQNPITSQQSGRDGTYERTLIWTSSYLTMRYVFVDPQDGSEFALEMVGEGKDSSDKAASKAASMACKYGLFQALMVPFEGMEESDGQHPQEEWTGRQRADWGPEGSPGQQVSRGTMSPARAVNEYVRNSPNNPAADGRPEPPADPPEVSAAKALRFMQNAMHAPTAVDSLTLLKQAASRIEELGIGQHIVEGIQLNAYLSSALQTAKAAIENRALSNTQGMSRAEQQAGQGARAAVPEPDGDDDADDPAPGSREEYEMALQVMGSNAPDQVQEQAARIVERYERAHPHNQAAIQEYYDQLGEQEGDRIGQQRARDDARDPQYTEQVDMTGRDGQW